jgi:hypothetical protein
MLQHTERKICCHDRRGWVSLFEFAGRQPGTCAKVDHHFRFGVEVL